MPRKPGDDIRIVIGSKTPVTYAVRPDSLQQITLVLRPKKAFSDAFCERLERATALYVMCATSRELALKGKVITLLDRWSTLSHAVRKNIWKEQANPTIKPQSRTTLGEIQKKYFRRETKLYEPLQGHRRHLMANAALGLDVALDLCRYVLQELKVDRRGHHARDLWDVWVAIIIAEFRAAGRTLFIKLKPKMKMAPRFGDLIRAVEDTFPDATLKRQYAPVVFRRRFKRAAMLARGQTPATLSKLMKLWGNYGRVQKSKSAS